MNDRLRGAARGVLPRRAGRGRPRPRPVRHVPPLVRGRGRGRLHEPNAMVLATVAPDGRPSARAVLLKGLDERGFVFYTNLTLPQGPRPRRPTRDCALLFPWHPLSARSGSRAGPSRCRGREVAAYFATRPRGAQLGAWASPQSEVVTARRSRRVVRRRGGALPGRGAAARPLGRLRRGAREHRVLAGPAQPDARPVALRARRAQRRLAASWRTPSGWLPEMADAESSGGGESLLTVDRRADRQRAGGGGEVGRGGDHRVRRRWSPRRCTRGPTRATRSSCCSPSAAGPARRTTRTRAATAATPTSGRCSRRSGCSRPVAWCRSTTASRPSAARARPGTTSSTTWSWRSRSCSRASRSGRR